MFEASLTLYEFFALSIIHWFADFFCQTHWMAVNKSSNNKALLSHTSFYSGIFAIFLFIMLIPFPNMELLTLRFFYLLVLFAIITFVAHTLTDYVTSRIVKKFFSKQDFHNGFVVIGVDQFLHAAQLCVTYYWLFK